MQYRLYFKANECVEEPTGFSGTAEDCMNFIRGWLCCHAHNAKTLPLQPMNPAKCSFSDDLIVRTPMCDNNTFQFKFVLSAPRKPLVKK